MHGENDHDGEESSIVLQDVGSDEEGMLDGS